MTRIDMTVMLTSMKRTLLRFQHWFDARFGWFFTNGMKDGSAPGKA